MASTGEPFGLFWDSENGDRTYSAASFEYWLKKFFISGVFNGDLQVQATSGMTVKVGAGYANVDGKVKFWNAEFNLTLSAANSIYPRIDTIVITRDNVNRQITCEVVTGSYSADTPQPTAPTRNAEIYQLVLAQIYVNAGATGITQADITDTRPDTDLCGWITGTVTEMDFSQFTAQFEAYFAEFKDEKETDYASWFNSVMAQEIADKAAWDAWYAALQEELHNLPSDSAEYLQIQIDELKESGLSGSILNISTINASLEGRTVTVTVDYESETKTGTFDSNLECVIYGIKSVGDITVTATDGIETATGYINIPYYGNYDLAIAFWLATVNIQGDENLYGATVTVKDSDNTTVGTVTLSSEDGTGVFEAKKADTYTFSVVYQGETITETLVVTAETTYSVELATGFMWTRWVTLGGLDPTDYTDLEDVFADEVAVRRLMTIHASADYLIDCVTDKLNDIDAFCANDTAMKWIGLRDYVCDGLTAITGIEAKFLASQYWERYLKDHVPVMTSNTAPYGTASASSAISGHLEYLAFDDSNSTFWQANSASTASNLNYAFTNPINVKRVYVHNYSSSYQINVKIQASNDNSNWIDVGTEESIPANTGKYINANNNDYFMYYRAYITSSSSIQHAIDTLQFYGRSLNVSVPVMTSDTAPYGEVIYTSQNSNYPKYKAFDGNTSNVAIVVDSVADKTIGYKFPFKVHIKGVYHYSNNTNYKGLDANAILQYSDDGTTWSGDYNIGGSTDNNYHYIPVTSDLGEHEYWRISDNRNWSLSILQFYGVDYSEREFAEGSTMKYLYDHGVELETINTTGTVTKDDDYITLSAANAQASHTLGLTPYDLLRGKVGDHMSGTTALIAGTTATANMTAANAPNNESLDVSSVNASLATGAKMTSTGICDIKELWLE